MRLLLDSIYISSTLSLVALFYMEAEYLENRAIPQIIPWLGDCLLGCLGYISVRSKYLMEVAIRSGVGV